ncbi:hydantoinase B/oxoprolinase family protein [Ramlibacter sp. AN1015]|uniref:hydantoinase B/oxoprolinase family protein n=1 Tax=Ramlibacter sp. AN1015 TaxID=3133428 RepID=UPI0030BF42E4
MAIGIGCDIGGTFTDLLLIDEKTGTAHVEKVLTTPDDPSRGIEDGLRGLEALAPGAVAEAGMLVHGTTLVINAVIERKGALTGLITTRGFRDVLEIGREKRYDGNDLQIRFPEPLVTRPLRTEVDERVHTSGRVLAPLDEASVEAAVRSLLASGAQSIAVCLLNSFANPAHEIRIGEIAARIAPNIPVTLSHEVLRELKEYERTTTTVVNAYAKPVVDRYLKRLDGRLADVKFGGEFLLMQSSGGLNSAAMARQFPVQIIESGPAAGMIGAAHYARLAGFDKVLAFDMGGTTAKMCLVADGRVGRVNELEVDRVHRFKRGSGIPVRVPVVDLMEIGAGGGSIAKVSAKGTMEVGPESASAMPGPVSYGQGGTEPTVSDADLVLGYLNPTYFLGGRMPLDREKAAAAIELELGIPLGLSTEKAAWGIHSVVNENMASAAKVYVAEKGESPSSCAIVAFGGAGPVHAYDLARRIGAHTVVIPPRAGVASAFGMLIAPASFDTVRTYRTRAASADAAKLDALYEDMEAQARNGLPRSTDPAQAWFERSADVRYVGQGYDVAVPIAPQMLRAGGFEQALRSAFNAVYQKLYGRVFDELQLEVMSLRVTAFAPGKTFADAAPVAASGTVTRAGRRDAWCPVGEKFVEHAVYHRAALPASATIDGPAIVEEPESTTIVGVGATLTIDKSGSLIVRLPRMQVRVASGGHIDAVSLEMLWRRLGSSVDELAAALVRTSFSSVIRDVNDYACGVFDAQARLLVRSTDSTPGIAGGLAPMLTHMLEKIAPETLREGDVLIGNDPWHGSGHHNDIFIVTPAFHEGRLIGYGACSAHHVDIGGRRATTESRDNYEEGLRIPVCRLYEAGEPNEDVFNFIASNVRLAETVLGDLRAQCAANHVGCERLRELCAEQGWRDFQPLADEIIRRSEELARAEIERIPDGEYTHEAPIEIIDGQPIRLKVKVTVKGDELTLDYTGSSAQVRPAVNCTIRYTAAYSMFAVLALLNLPVQGNEGSMRPIRIVAEEGSVVNARFPAPVFARTSIGNFIPETIFSALAPALPDRVVAASGSTPLWAQYIFGKRRDGTSFAPLNAANGGLGARAGQDGVSCLTFPVNIGNTPVEILESDIPALVKRRELWEDSAGAGRFRGGLGQRFEMVVLEGDIGPDGPFLIGFRGGRYHFTVPGLLGGEDGPNGRLIINGKQAFGGGDASVPPGGTMLCEIPGGAGLGDPRKRSRALIERDVAYGYVSAEKAREIYGWTPTVEVAK